MRVAFFTAGTVGAGHLVRSIAVGRGLRRRGFAGDYRAFGPELPFAVAQRGDYHPIVIDPAQLKEPASARQTPLALALADFAPDVLLVDLFWAPLRNLLPLPGCEAWLLVRCVPAKWFSTNPDWGYLPAQYRRVIGIEPWPAAQVRERIDPIVVCNPDECRPPGALRERLAVPAGKRLALVAHAGVAGEAATLQAAAGADTVALDLFQPEALFPLAEWLPGADEIRGGAGYNLFWETRWLGLAGRSTLTPLPRRIDDQAWRLRECSGYRMRENGADALARMLLG